jgi:hypothetical protein
MRRTHCHHGGSAYDGVDLCSLDIIGHLKGQLHNLTAGKYKDGYIAMIAVFTCVCKDLVAMCSSE